MIAIFFFGDNGTQKLERKEELDFFENTNHIYYIKFVTL